MKYKKMIALIAAAGMIGTLGGCGLKAPEKPSQAPSGETEQAPKETSAKADGAVTLVYAEVNSIDSLDGEIATFFKDKVEEKTNGSVVIDIQASGVLGAEADVLTE